MRRSLLLCVFLVSLSGVRSELISLTTGAVVAGAAGGILGGYHFVKCKFMECCDAPWIYANTSSNLHGLLEDKLYGQHLAKDLILRSVRAHMQNKKPKKALVLSLHGWTGSGKNYVASMLGRAMYRNGPQSHNAGGTDIAKRSLQHYEEGHPREELGHRELQEIIQNCAYNEGEGGLKKSELVARHLIDVFVPFLPLERKHVRMCGGGLHARSGLPDLEERVEAVVNEMVFFPRENPIFSTSGCKSVAQKADLFYAHERDPLLDGEDELF
ncbi:Torsin [Aphelenchoides fujianensis]|nr:Torsin [Aphelenchoides fujianensis]